MNSSPPISVSLQQRLSDCPLLPGDQEHCLFVQNMIFVRSIFVTLCQVCSFTCSFSLQQLLKCLRNSDDWEYVQHSSQCGWSWCTVRCQGSRSWTRALPGSWCRLTVQWEYCISLSHLEYYGITQWHLLGQQIQHSFILLFKQNKCIPQFWTNQQIKRQILRVCMKCPACCFISNCRSKLL